MDDERATSGDTTGLGGDPVGSSDAGPGAPQPLYFHVGLPKSGSTYLQTVMGNNRAALREEGHVYPYVRQEGMFHAAVEMAGSPERWGLERADIEGTFAHILRRGRRLGGAVVVSHEIFGSASREQIRAMQELLADFDVHLVVTARDLGRTVTAEWQEQVKNGRARTFQEFADHLLAALPDDPADTRPFWRSQNLLLLLDRWQLLVPPERIHLVTCPRSGGAPDLLWRRFAEAIALRPDSVDLSETPTRNESLGTAQIAFLRHVVTALDGRLEQPWYSRLAKRWFAQTLLCRGTSAKPVTPAPVAERLAVVAQAWTDHIRQGGYQVHGDLDELVPLVADRDTPHPDATTEAEMLQPLPEVVAEMLLRARNLTVDLSEATERVELLTTERDQLTARVDELSALVAELNSPRHRWLPFRARREPSAPATREPDPPAADQAGEPAAQ